jgi:hypothetical protein
MGNIEDEKFDLCLKVLKECFTKTGEQENFI